MLDAEFRNVVTLRLARPGSRKNASEVTWDRVLGADNEPIRIPCRFRRSGVKNFTLQAGEEESDATMLFQVTATQDVTRENLVIDQRGEAYKVLRFREDEDADLNTVYKQVELKKVDKSFPEDPVDVR
jgi:hypothetical protein